MQRRPSEPSTGRAPIRLLALTLALAPVLGGGLAGCGVVRDVVFKPRETEPPTLRVLAQRRIDVQPDAGVPVNEEAAIAAYRRFLAQAPDSPQRAQALRRLGDLAMDLADRQAGAPGPAGAAPREGTAIAAAQPASAPAATAAADNGSPDYQQAVARYHEALAAYPQAAGNDKLLYQLARAHEQGGQLELALKTLDRLVREHPATAYRDEAQFRRGELLFTLRDYAGAEKAFAQVLASKDENPYDERALYMHGWALFKQGRLEDALPSFFGLLDITLDGVDDSTPLAEVEGLSRADRELVEDTFRVTGLTLQNLKGADSIPALMDSPARAGWEPRLYQQLADLYLKQERYKDATDTLLAFANRHPGHTQAPAMRARVIAIHQQTGFDNLALAGKQDYVERYGGDAPFRRDNPEAWQAAQPAVQGFLAELALRAHAAAQKSKAGADYAEAVRWYRALLKGFPDAAEVPRNQFLLGELLYEDHRYAEAAPAYEQSAYEHPAHALSADAGYAAILAHAAEDRAAPAEPAAAHTALRRASVDSARRFAAAFPDDARTAPVLTHAAEQLYALQDGEGAAALAQQVLARTPPAAPALRRTAWTVVAHTAFEAGAFGAAEGAYREVLALAPAQDPQRKDLSERLSAAIYKQGEAARAAGQGREAAELFARVADAAPASPVRIGAQFDAAAQLIALADWPAAARTLEDFRQRFPSHPLQAQVPARLAVVYEAQQRWPQAAAEYERIAAVPGADPALARGALWQAAVLRDRALAGLPAAAPAAAPAPDTNALRTQAARGWDRYLKAWPAPLEPALEARAHLAALATAEGQAPRALALAREILAADQAGGANRTARTRTLGAEAALALAQPVVEAYRRQALVEPLPKSLKLKKARMDEAMKALAGAAGYGIDEVASRAAADTAELYREFAKALIASERPKKLAKLEREQYDVLLEEQAFPFEEKAIALHEQNVARTSAGAWDEGVRRSLAALRQLRPVRWNKEERSLGVLDAVR